MNALCSSMGESDVNSLEREIGKLYKRCKSAEHECGALRIALQSSEEEGARLCAATGRPHPPASDHTDQSGVHLRARIHSATEEIHQLQRDNRQLTDALDKANETAQQMSALAHQFNLPDAQSAHNFKPEVSLPIFHTTSSKFGHSHIGSPFRSRKAGAPSWVLFNRLGMRLIGFSGDLDMHCEVQHIFKYDCASDVFFLQALHDGVVVNHIFTAPHLTLQAIKAIVHLLLSGKKSLRFT